MSSSAAAASRRWNCRVWPWRGQAPHGDAAGVGVGAQDVAHQEIAAVEILQVFVDDQADEQIAARLQLFAAGEIAERLGQDFIGGAVGDFGE